MYLILNIYQNTLDSNLLHTPGSTVLFPSFIDFEQASVVFSSDKSRCDWEFFLFVWESIEGMHIHKVNGKSSGNRVAK